MVDYKALIEKNKAGIARLFREHWLLIILGILGVLCVYFYFTVIFRRVPRCMGKLDMYESALSIHPVTSCPKLIENGYKLCDFYVASAYRPYLPCCQSYDYGALEMIEKVIRMGARYLELDLYNLDFCPISDIVVCTGKQPGNWHYTTPLLLKEVCNIISTTAFSPSLSNATDPMFLCLNLNMEGNEASMNSIAKILNDTLGNWMLGQDYHYQRTNLAMVELKEILGKIVILCGDRCQGTKLAEIVNYTWKQPFMRSYSHIEVLDFHEPTEVTDYNRLNLTRCYPKFSGRDTENYNPRLAWMYGCQFVAMNYGKPDDNMIIYWKKFKRSSFVLKPYKLRFHPKYYKTPKAQTKNVSFAPMQHSTPDYSITY